ADDPAGRAPRPACAGDRGTGRRLHGRPAAALGRCGGDPPAVPASAADPAGPDATRVRNTYRVLHAGSLVQEQVVERTLPLVRGSVLLAEAASAGLTANRPDSELLVLRRS